MRGKVTRKRMSVFSTYDKIINVCEKYNDIELMRIARANYLKHYILIMKYLIHDQNIEEFLYFDEVYHNVKKNLFSIIFNKYIHIKDKLNLFLAILFYHLRRRGTEKNEN